MPTLSTCGAHVFFAVHCASLAHYPSPLLCCPGHLCEFHGLDLEMTINEHYYEVLDVFSDLFIFIFDELNKRCKPEIEAVRAQYPFEDLKVRPVAPRCSHALLPPHVEPAHAA